MKLPVYKVTKGTTEMQVPGDFTKTPNLPLLAQAVHVYESRKHPSLARTKTRGEINISRKKIYRQKGTGGARHGAKSAPIFIGGGVAFGPTGVKRVRTLPSKMRAHALKSAIAYVITQKSAALFDIATKIVKTSDAQKLVTNIQDGKNVKLTLVFSASSLESMPAFRNIPNVTTVPFTKLNAHTLLKGGFIAFDKQLFEVKKTAKKQTKTTSKK